MTAKKELIEVALPLQAINEASAREKSVWPEHPSTLHMWCARWPVAAARARASVECPRGRQARGYDVYTRRPFRRELDIGVTSVNSDLAGLILRAAEPS